MEKYVAKNKRIYFVYDYSRLKKDRTKAIQEVSKMQKVSATNYKIVPAWIKDDDLYLKKVEDSTKKMAVIRK